MTGLDSTFSLIRYYTLELSFPEFQGFESGRVRLWDRNFPDVCNVHSALQLYDPWLVEFFEHCVLEIMGEYFFMTVPTISHHGRSNLAQPNPVTPSCADERESRRIPGPGSRLRCHHKGRAVQM